MMTSNMTPSCYVLLISAFCVASVMCANKTDETGIKVSEKALMRSLLSYYNSEGIDGRPVKNPAHPVKVKMGVKLTKILNFDQENDKLTIAAWLVLNWVDEYLHYDAVTGIKRVFIPPSKVWTPDISLFNAMEPPERMINPLVIVRPNGNVTWVPYYKVTTACKTTPDQKETSCYLRFGSWVYNNKQLQLDFQAQSISASGDYYYYHEDWELLKTDARKEDKEYEYMYRKGEKYTRITYTLVLRKRPKKDDDKDKGSAAPPVGQHSSYKSWFAFLTIIFTLLINSL